MTELVDTLTVRQDIGGPYPVYKNVILEFWSDGTVTWRARTNPDYHSKYIGDPKDRRFG